MASRADKQPEQGLVTAGAAGAVLPNLELICTNPRLNLIRD